jgi:hypothetical protein
MAAAVESWESKLTSRQHTTGDEFDTNPSLSNNVTISKAEHEFMVCLSLYHSHGQPIVFIIQH